MVSKVKSYTFDTHNKNIVYCPIFTQTSRGTHYLAFTIDLRNNSKSIDLQNGYAEIIPIDTSKTFKSKKI